MNTCLSIEMIEYLAALYFVGINFGVVLKDGGLYGVWHNIDGGSV